MTLPVSAKAACINPEGIPGDVMYNADHDVFQGCLADAGWVAFHQPVSELVRPTGCPNVGDECIDGTFYAGQFGGSGIYVSSSAHQVSRTWNNGTTNWTASGMGYCSSPFTQQSCSDGPGNTALLVGLSDAAAPYEAAGYCAGLTAHGYDDWYLPPRAELDLLWNEGSPIADVLMGTSNWYWSSSENTNLHTWVQRFSDGVQSGHSKSNGRLVRCVRRG